MDKSKRNLIGVLTVIPAIYTFLFLVITFSNNYNLTFVPPFFIFVVLHATMTILSMVLLAVYLMDLIDREWDSRKKRLLWAILLIFGGMLTAPIYFCLYMRKDNSLTTGYRNL